MRRDVNLRACQSDSVGSGSDVTGAETSSAVASQLQNSLGCPEPLGTDTDVV